MPNPAQVRHKTCTTRLPTGNADWLSAKTMPAPPGEVSAGTTARRVRGTVDHLVPAARRLLGRRELPGRLRRPSRLTRLR